MVSTEKHSLKERIFDATRTIGQYALWPIIKPERTLAQCIANEHRELKYWAEGANYLTQEAEARGRKVYDEQHRHWTQRLRHKVITALAVAALIPPAASFMGTIERAGDLPEPGNTAISDQPMFSPNTKRALFTDYVDIQNYWKTRGVDITDTSLVRLEGWASTDCDVDPIFANDRSSFCPNSNTIAITAKSANQWDKLGAPGRHFLLAHEGGHSVQAKLKQAPPKPAEEMQATCYAGQAIQKLYPNDVPSLIRSLPEHISTTPEHGTPKQQTEAFILGAHGGSCTEQSILQIVKRFSAPTPTVTIS